MSEREEPLLIIKAHKGLSEDQWDLLHKSLSKAVDGLGMTVVITDSDMDAYVDRDIAPHINRMIEQQEKTNRLQAETNMLLAALIDALAEEQVDGEAQPKTYMDGKLV